MKRIFFPTLAAALCLAGSYGYGQQLDKVRYTVSNDFETGELFGWEAYPYAQDIAFDALYFARSNPTHNNSKYALARPLKANDTGEFEHGMTKRFNFWTTPETVVKCAIYFQSDRNPETLEIGIGTFEGERFTHTIENPQANQWLELALPMTSFRSDNGSVLTAGKHVQVMTVKGSYPVVSYLYTYTILMDDFEVNGERQRRFIATNPSSTDFELFDVSILNKHFFEGDDIALQVTPENNTALRAVKGVLLDGKGKVVKDDIPFKSQGNEWVNPSIYKVGKQDNAGQWTINLSGVTAEGEQVEWGFRFLVPVKRVNEHPRLFFSAEELQSRLQNEDSPAAKKILENALKNTDFMEVDIDAIEEGVDRTGENLIGPAYAKNSVGYNAYGAWMNPMTQLGNIIREGSFRYAFTGDKAAAEKAKKALLKLCSFSKWNADWMLERKFYTYYPVGYTLKPVAYGYDMLHDILTAEERKFVRDAIMEKGLKLFYRDMVEMNRMPSQQTNHIAVIVSGYGLAATAIYGEDKDNPYLEPYLSGLMTKAKAFLDHTYYADGSYGEPMGYMDMASRSIVEILSAFERNFGVDYTTTTDMPNFYKYPLYASYDNGLIPAYGDGGRAYSGFSQVHAQWVVHRTGNPFLYPYVKASWDKGNGGYMAYLWYRDDITPVLKNTLPTSRVFEAKGMVMRAGWDDRDAVITTRVGPNSNHYHYDQGSFQVMINGEELLTDPGIGAAGYYANPEYLSYDVQSIAHNVMLVDHNPESQNPAHYDNGIAALREWPRMTLAFTSEIVDAMESDLKSVYRDKLDTYTRTLLYAKGGTLFLFDRVKSKSPKGEVYDWLFHAPKNDGERAIAVDGNRLTVDRPNARLTLDVVTPQFDPSISEGYRHENGSALMVPQKISAVSIRDRYDLKFPESFATFSSAENLSEINFFAVMVPEAKPVSGDFGPRPTTERIESGAWIGAKVERQDGTDFGFFRKDARHAAGTESVAGFDVDADRFVVSYTADDRLEKLYFEGNAMATGDFSVQADRSVVCAVAMDGQNKTITIDAPEETELMVYSEVAPKNVQMDAQGSKQWQYRKAEKRIVIGIPAGKHQITID